jgi:hypothetical protein
MLAFALAILAQQSPESAAFRARLADDDPEVREAAVDELVRIGKPALKAIRTLREDGDVEVRGRAERALKAIAAALRSKALKLEVAFETAAIKAGTAPTFTAKLVNVEEVDVEVLRPAALQPWESPRWSGQRRQQWVGWNHVEECLQPKALRPGESIDVTAEVSVTFKDGRARGWDRLGKGRHAVVFTWRPASAVQAQDPLSSQIEAQEAEPQRSPSREAGEGTVTVEREIEVQ